MKSALSFPAAFVAGLLLASPRLASQGPGCSSCGCPDSGAPVHGPGPHPDPALVPLLGGVPPSRHERLVTTTVFPLRSGTICMVLVTGDVANLPAVGGESTRVTLA